jgi:DUF4097 and DUF4098 domain-containing protein YvlB
MNILSKALAFVAMVTLCGAATAQETGDRTTVSFTDPSRPGVLNVRLIRGSITVKGGDVKDVIIETHPHGPDIRRGDPKAAAGLRRLTQQPSISVEEQNNRMEIRSPHVNRGFNLEIQVPRRTHLDLSTVNQGNVYVEGVEGELEIGNVNGPITLSGVSGAVIAHTVNGKVLATLSSVTPQKPMAFTSLNGTVDVTLPATTRGNLKLRSDNGDVFTDFDLSILPQTAAPVVEDTRRSDGRYRVEVNKLIYGALNGGGAEIEMRTFNGDIYVRKGS